MPTSDPVRRRRQNCENQKKFRERQTKQLQELRLSHQRHTQVVAELEAEIKRLVSIEQKSQEEIRHLQEANLQLTHTLEAFNAESTKLPKEVWLQRSAIPETVNGNVTTSYWPQSSSPPETLCCPVNGALPEPLPGNHVSLEVMEPLGVGPFIVHEYQTKPEAASEDASISPISAHSLDAKETKSPYDELWMDAGWTSLPLLPKSDPFGAADSLIDDISQNKTDDDNKGIHIIGQQPTVRNLHNVLAQFGFLDPQWPAKTIMGGTYAIAHSLWTFPFPCRISRHIMAMNQVIWNEFSTLPYRSNELTKELMASAFCWLVREAWLASKNCFKFMSTYKHIFDYELFRMFPCKETYENLHPLFRPTPMQIAVFHKPAIDWIPWPDLRDKIIQMQDKVDLDFLFQVALSNTVVEPYGSPDRMPGAHQPATIRVWELYLLEKHAGSVFSPDAHAMVHIPSSAEVANLTANYAIQPQDLLQLAVDRPFFDVFPCMYDERYATKFPRRTILPSSEEVLSYPAELTRASIGKLRNVLWKTVGDWAHRHSCC